MQVYASIDDIRLPLAEVPAFAQRAERLGFDGLLVPEAVNDAMLVALLALEHTQRLRVTTAVAVAFARSPMLIAQDAWSLQRLSGGRFELGLGPQVRGNIVRRYGMSWSPPAARMRDYVGALRAIFDCWQDGKPLRYESESYRLDRMQPFFEPGPIDHPHIPILLGAIGPRMLRVTGEVADGVITHPTAADPATLRQLTIPALTRGASPERPLEALRVIANPMVATGPDPEAVAAEREKAREVLAFTYSTPAYRATLELHGWGEVGARLHAMSRGGQWSEMTGLISDEMLDVLVPCATFSALPGVLHARYDGLAQAVALRVPRDSSTDSTFADALAALRAEGVVLQNHSKAEDRP